MLLSVCLPSKKMVALRTVNKEASHCVVIGFHQPSATFLTNKKQIEIIL